MEHQTESDQCGETFFQFADGILSHLFIFSIVSRGLKIP